MAGKPLIIEAKINEYALRKENGQVPFSADEVGEEAARPFEAGAKLASPPYQALPDAILELEQRKRAMAAARTISGS